VRFIYKNHFLVPLVSALSGALDRIWRLKTGEWKLEAGGWRPEVSAGNPNPESRDPKAGEERLEAAANPAAVQIQTRMRGPRLIVQAVKLAVSAFEMETLGRFAPGAGVYLLLEKPTSG
jgi:hypothetical protein